MPSPLAHAAAGYVVYRIFRSPQPARASGHVGPLPRLLVATVGLSLLADVDVVPGILLLDVGRFHNAFSSGLITGVAVALTVGGALWLRQRSGFKFWFALTLVCYESHVLMDFLTIGRGVMLAWPFSDSRIGHGHHLELSFPAEPAAWRW